MLDKNKFEDIDEAILRIYKADKSNSELSRLINEFNSDHSIFYYTLKRTSETIEERSIATLRRKYRISPSINK